MNRVASTQKEPNNAWVFFSIERGDQPVTGLNSDDFTIFEDGNAVSKQDTKQMLQYVDTASVMDTLLLIDASGTNSAAMPDAVADAAKAFVDRVGKSQKVGVYVYDGEAKIHPIVPFADAADAAAVDPAQAAKLASLAKPAAPSAPASVYDALRTFRAKDPSNNLNGAVIEGLRELSRALDRERKPLHFGTLVVVGQGPDRAARATREAVTFELDDPKYKLFQVLAVGTNAENGYLFDVGRDGSEAIRDRAALKGALDRMATKIEARQRRYYLLSFCTSARNGEREVRIEAHIRKPEGTGALIYTFDADGLGPPPDCDPRTPPPLDLKPVSEGWSKDEAPPVAKPPPKPAAKPVLHGTPPPEKPAPPH